MAKIIDDETMENVCILAKLSLTEDEKEKAKEDMQKMLDYVDKLDELDTSSVEPMSHIFEDENVFREDIVTNGDNHEAMLALWHCQNLLAEAASDISSTAPYTLFLSFSKSPFHNIVYSIAVFSPLFPQIFQLLPSVFCDGIIFTFPSLKFL